FAVASLDTGAHLLFRLRRVEKQDVGALGDECPYSRQRLVKAARHAGVGTRQQQNALIAAGLDRRPAAQDRMLALAHQLRAVAAKRTRPYLVFNQHRRGAATRVSANDSLHGESIAVTGIAI